MKNLISAFCITLSVLGIWGCTKQPTASIAASKTSVSSGESISFTNTSKDGESYKWNFGDGTNSTEASPTKSYASPGNYQVEMTVYSKKEKKSDKATISISVIQPNEIQYDGAKYPLTKGYLEYYGNLGGTENFYNFDVTLVDNGITITQTTGVGTGNVIYMEMWSSLPSDLDPGTYVFAANRSPLTLSTGSCFLNFNIATSLGTVLNCSGASVIVSKSGTNYNFDITYSLATGKTVRAYYKGALIYYDQSKPASKRAKAFAMTY